MNDWYFLVLFEILGYLEGVLRRDSSSGSRGGGSRLSKQDVDSINPSRTTIRPRLPFPPLPPLRPSTSPSPPSRSPSSYFPPFPFANSPLTSWKCPLGILIRSERSPLWATTPLRPKVINDGPCRQRVPCPWSDDSNMINQRAGGITTKSVSKNRTAATNFNMT